MLQTCKLSRENQKMKKNKDWCFWLQASFVFRDCSEAVFFVKQELGASSFPARIELLNAFPFNLVPSWEDAHPQTHLGLDNFFTPSNVKTIMSDLLKHACDYMSRTSVTQTIMSKLLQILKFKNIFELCTQTHLKIISQRIHFYNLTHDRIRYC